MDRYIGKDADWMDGMDRVLLRIIGVIIVGK
jgi:hypothetical protein